MLAGVMIARAAAAPAAMPELFGTVALSAGTTPYDQRWSALAARPPSASLHRLVEAAAGLDPDRQLRFVQLLVNRTMTYRDDATLWGQRDYWANPDETFSRRAGDCEDLALVKLDALRGLGFAPDDLVLAVGRDRARGEHALALVRIGEQWWVLDDDQDRPIAPHESSRFEPVISLSLAGGRWLHGRRLAADAARAPSPDRRLP